MPKYHVNGDGTTTAPPEAEKHAREVGIIGVEGGIHNPQMVQDLRKQASAEAQTKGKPDPFSKDKKR